MRGLVSTLILGLMALDAGGLESRASAQADSIQCFDKIEAPHHFASGRSFDRFQARLAEFMAMPADTGGIVFVGDSLFHRADISGRLLKGMPVINLGIGGDEASGVLKRFDILTAIEPDQVVILIGTNDIRRGRASDEIKQNITHIVERASGLVAGPDLLFVSVLPREEEYDARIDDVNSHITQLSELHTFEYIDAYAAMAEDGTRIKPEYTHDGVHLTREGYFALFDEIRPYLDNDVQFRASESSLPISNYFAPECGAPNDLDRGAQVP